VFVSHSESQVADLCDRAIWIDGGKVRSEGDSELVIEQYRASMNNKAKKKSSIIL